MIQTWPFFWVASCEVPIIWKADFFETATSNRVTSRDSPVMLWKILLCPVIWKILLGPVPICWWCIPMENKQGNSVVNKPAQGLNPCSALPSSTSHWDGKRVKNPNWIALETQDLGFMLIYGCSSLQIWQFECIEFMLTQSCAGITSIIWLLFSGSSIGIVRWADYPMVWYLDPFMSMKPHVISSKSA